MTDEEREAAQAEMEATAGRADVDLEQKLADLLVLHNATHPDSKLKAQYERLRDELTAVLAKDGPRYFLDPSGFKHYATAVTPEPLEISVEGLSELYRAGELDIETFNKITTIKILPEEFRKAVSRGEITSEQLVQVAKTKKGTAHVKFSDPLG